MAKLDEKVGILS